MFDIGVYWLTAFDGVCVWRLCECPWSRGSEQALALVVKQPLKGNPRPQAGFQTVQFSASTFPAPDLSILPGRIVSGAWFSDRSWKYEKLDCAAAVLAGIHQLPLEAQTSWPRFHWGYARSLRVNGVAVVCGRSFRAIFPLLKKRGTFSIIFPLCFDS